MSEGAWGGEEGGSLTGGHGDGKAGDFSCGTKVGSSRVAQSWQEWLETPTVLCRLGHAGERQQHFL